MRKKLDPVSVKYIHINPKTSEEARLADLQLEQAYNILFQEMEKQGLLTTDDSSAQ